MTTNQSSQLDFSGGPKSWFDLWHTHVDWDGEGNADWTARKRFLDQLIGLYNEYRQKLKNYPGEFQLWILIDDADSGQDAVYIHTKNPNADNFPYRVLGDKTIRTNNLELKTFLKSSEFDIAKQETKDGDVYFLFQRGIGIGLV